MPSWNAPAVREDHLEMREHEIRPAELLDRFFELLDLDARELAERRAEFVDVDCVFCGSLESELAFRKQGFAYRACRACSSLFVSPRPTDAALRAHAANSRAVQFWSTHLYRETAAARREKMFRPRAMLAASIASRHGVGDRAVDIGSGYGLFLAELAATNAFRDVIGIEPDARLAAIARDQGHTVIERWVEDIEPEQVEADLAACFEVIEHVFDPVAFLRSCARTLRSGGHLLFTTLTIGGFDLQVLWEHSRAISPPQHINFPTLSGIERAIARSGLVAVDISTPGELDVDIVRNVAYAQPDLALPRIARRLIDLDDRGRADLQIFLQRHLLSSHLRCLVRRLT